MTVEKIVQEYGTEKASRFLAEATIAPRYQIELKNRIAFVLERYNWRDLAWAKEELSIHQNAAGIETAIFKGNDFAFKKCVNRIFRNLKSNAKQIEKI